MGKRHKNFKVLLCSLVTIFMASLLLSNPHFVSAATSSSKVGLNTSYAYLIPGETTDLKVMGTSKKITWSSTNKDIIAVSSTGKVKALQPGIAYIKAKVDNKTFKCKVTVFYPPEYQWKHPAKK